MLNRRPSDAVLLVLAVAVLVLVLTSTLALHHLVIGDQEGLIQPGRAAVGTLAVE